MLPSMSTTRIRCHVKAEQAKEIISRDTLKRGRAHCNVLGAWN